MYMNSTYWFDSRRLFAQLSITRQTYKSLMDSINNNSMDPINNRIDLSGKDPKAAIIEQIQREAAVVNASRLISVIIPFKSHFYYYQLMG